VSVTSDFGWRLSEERSLVYHLTRAASLPDIAASGALLCAGARRGEPLRHGWGVNDHQGRGLVCLSLIPSYGILSHQIDGEEAAILGFETKAVAGLPGLLPCPHNSAERKATPYLDGTIDRARASKELFAQHAWRQAELLVPEAVPLGALKLIVLPDQEAHARWARPLLDDLGSDLSSRVEIRTDRPDGPRPHFPPWYTVTKRPPVRPGEDQRQRVIRPIDPATVPDIDFGVVDEELHWMDHEDDERDLYDDLYGAGRRDRLLSSLLDEPYGEYREDPSC
jgi:hypothetical protein